MKPLTTPNMVHIQILNSFPELKVQNLFLP